MTTSSTEPTTTSAHEPTRPDLGPFLRAHECFRRDLGRLRHSVPRLLDGLPAEATLALPPELREPYERSWLPAYRRRTDLARFA
ncbi:hypothetical protein F0L68_26450 [Solihabitans fulvus]|uniref:Uncharacterized protein n=1 Tax=Solihabitans fulvus TaxID=1892852 RepID=A0A5B2X0F1_9PSEU|nr:hypothetical protein [Solihabitans fulvus]KAA2256329.1 hypothetical protein F0L68_26450 [Solihabitans fulvus]